MSPKRFARSVVLSLLGLAMVTCGVWAQSTPSSAPARTGEATPPADPLDRETPYGTVTGFLKTAGKGNYEVAAGYLQLFHKKPTARDHTTAHNLEVILNHNYLGSPDRISRDREGTLTDGLPPDRESIGKARTLGLTIDIELVRVSDPQVGKIWLISAETLKQVTAFYEKRFFAQYQESLPSWLNQTEIFSLTALELLIFFFALPIAWLVAGLTISVVGWGVRRYLSRFTRAGWRQSGLLAKAPLRLALTSVFHYILVSPALPLLYTQYYGRIVRILFVVALYWLLSNVTDEAVARLEDRLPPERKASTHSLLALGRRVWKVLIVLVLFLIVLKSFGFDVNSALAGIGIGGIALGLGAQKTLENLFGGISVLSDATIRVGDFCKVGDQIGTVEDIGLRATRIRTNARTVVSIPNGAIATANLENFAARDKILMNTVVSLRYETSADQLRYVISQIRELLSGHARVEPETLRVRFIRLGGSSLDVEIFAYVRVSDYPEFLSIQEEILLRMMEIVEESGTGFAFPSQTMYLGRDPGLNREKTQAALARSRAISGSDHVK